MIYPLGCQIVIQNLNTGKQQFLRGHENNVSCISMSKTGKYIASGQVRLNYKSLILATN